ncbi:enteropeptidase [Eurytemora carolleeae]|uniref:enteropeptidase n=1 Tax=Eurytemora carolleeae TaxID=1294199 RepID=UPI000C777E79|nr:enteropeptidase [Eurytemora carolleeae]|eukprot:XP_023349460.1 enteropeptidase-like [Eurytemora affinis]
MPIEVGQTLYTCWYSGRIMFTFLFVFLPVLVYGIDGDHCYDYADDGYFCVDVFLCKNSSIVTDGRTVISVRQDSETRSRDELARISSCNTISQICCQRKDMKEKTEPVSDSDLLTDLHGDGILEEVFSPPLKPENRYCVEFEDDGFHCVPYYLCKNNTIVTSGEGLITIRDGLQSSRHEEAIRSSCGTILGVCCKLKERSAAPSAPPSSPVRFTEPLIAAGSAPTLTTVENPGQKIFPKCGIRNIDGLKRPEFDDVDQSRVENISKFGEWPHVCMLLEKKGTAIVAFRGGASLVDTDVVLTGAIKVAEDVATPDIFLVRCGEWDAKNPDNTSLYRYQERSVKKIVLHPGFKEESLHNNFAVLFLDREFEISDHIRPICLPKPGVVFPEGTDCYAHGWGKDRFDGNYQATLKSVRLPLVSNMQCENLLRKTRLTEYFILHESFVCAGAKLDVDTCKGDGGGPLACKEPGTDNIYVQVGIVSWGVDCGQKDTPGVYSNLPLAVCWIDNVVMCNKGYSDSAFGFSPNECPSVPRSSNFC